MKIIATRRINTELATKVQQYIKKAGQHMGNDFYMYNLEIRKGSDDGLMIDAMIHINDKSIEVVSVYEMIYDQELGKPKARNINGEKGSYAKLLSEKYLNAFIEYVENVDLETCKDSSFLMTKEMYIQMEKEIDDYVYDKMVLPMCELDDDEFDVNDFCKAVANKYEIEPLIEYTLSFIRAGLEYAGMEATASYNKFAHKFYLIFAEPYTSKNISISFEDVVGLKKNAKCTLADALLSLVLDGLALV